MKQTYHSNSTTNVRLRSEINKSNLPYSVLATQYGISENTVGKWKNRIEFEDKSSRPNTIKYALRDRKSVVQGKSVDLGGRRIIKKKTKKNIKEKTKKKTTTELGAWRNK